MIYFTSDQHFSHKKVIEYSNRPFENIHEMNDEIISRYNNLVTDKDTVYFLGDVAFCKEQEANILISQMKGHKILILGNHDKKKKYKGFERIENLLEFKHQNHNFVLCHYPMLVWNKHHYGSIHLHGHCHGTMMKKNPDYYKRKVLDVGVDVWHYYPVSVEDVIKITDQREIFALDHHQDRL